MCAALDGEGDAGLRLLHRLVAEPPVPSALSCHRSTSCSLSQLLAWTTLRGRGMCWVCADPIPVPAAAHGHRDVPGSLRVPFLQPHLLLNPGPKCTTAAVPLESRCMSCCGRLGGRHTARCLLPVPCCPFPAACSMLPVPCCLLPAARSLLPVPCCLFHAARSLLPVPCCPFPAACCRLPTQRRGLPAGHPVARCGGAGSSRYLFHGNFLHFKNCFHSGLERRQIFQKFPG